jgi:hypothetical protein
MTISAFKRKIQATSQRCGALCHGCRVLCSYTAEHRRSHGGHHRTWCAGRDFALPKVCKRCNEQVLHRPDWDICRPCAILIELKHAPDFATALTLAQEMMKEISGRSDGLILPTP